MRGRLVGGVVLTLIIVAILGALGTGLYQAGVDAGLASTGSDIVVQPRVVPGFYPYYGIGVFGLMIKALLAFLFFGLLARMFFFGRWSRHGDHWKGGPRWNETRREEFRGRMEEHLAEWHERAHGESPGASTEPEPDAG